MSKYNKKVDFSSVIRAMKDEGSSQGFRELRDFLIKNYDSLKSEFGSANIISLAISCDKHAIFADMAATKGKEDANKKWGWFQSYMEVRLRNLMFLTTNRRKRKMPKQSLYYQSPSKRADLEHFLSPYDVEYGAHNVCEPESQGSPEKSFGELAEKSEGEHESEGQGGN